MADKYTIDVEARFVDNISDGAKDAADSLKDIEDAAKKAKKETDGLGKKKVKPDVDADTNKFLRKIRQAENRARKFAGTKTTKVLSAIDKASAVINKVVNKSKNIAGKTWKAYIKVRDSDAVSALKNIGSMGRSLAGKTWTTLVKIKDYATAPLTKIKNALFSIKTLIGAIAAGWAANQLIANPIQLADAYSSAQIGFSTLLGKDAGQKMMDDLDAFAKATPFGTSDVISQAQRMIAMGWDANSIITDMETIGDAAAATGKGTEGLQSIVTALAQIKSKGKLSTEELNQLAEAGISAKRYIAEGLGYGSGDEGLAAMTKDLENGAIGSEAALQALLSGMKEYQGMMETTANETVGGLWSQIQDAFEINIFRRWGQGLQDGAKRGFGAILDLLDSSEDALATFGDMVYDIGKSLSNWAADKLENVVATVKEITGTEEFQNASLGGKISMLWEGVVSNPLAEWWSSTVVPWWDSTAVPWLAERAASMGAAIGQGLTSALVTLFGGSDALIDGAEQGATIAGSFVQGFTDNFDGSAITEAFVIAISNVWDALPAWAKILIGGKVVSSGIGTFNGVVGGVKAFAANAGTVLGSASAGTGLLGLGSNTAIALGAGNLAGGASVGAAGLSALGLGSIFGGVAGAAGIVDGIFDIFKGTKSSGRKAQDSYFKGGTKLGLVGSGAAAGAAIGSVVPGAGTAVGGLIGAGVGGLSAMFGGDKLGEILSEFFTETLPEKWGEFWDGVGEFFSETVPSALSTASEKVSTFFMETVPEKWGEFWDGVGEFFTETVPYALGYAVGKVYAFFTETIPEKWDALWNAIGTFFTETIPQWASVAWNDHIVPFFTETIPEKWDVLWETIGTFFTETIPEWASSVWNDNIVPFFTETIPGFFSSLWDSVCGFFTEQLPSLASGIWSSISTFFTETIPGWISSAISSVKNSFTSGFSAGSKGGAARGGVFGGTNAMDAFYRGGIAGYPIGGMVRGGPQLIKVAEEGTPEMIIPLGIQRRDRALQLWAKTGEMLGVGRFARGGRTDGQETGLQFYDHSDSASPALESHGVQVDVGGVHVEINVQAGDSTNIAEAIKAQANEIAETVAGVIADALSGQFENTPVRGGA